MLRVVVENLLANSIRYAGQGTTCTIELANPPSGPVLTVSDDGGGVAGADLPRLFERFYRGDQARTSRGTGLGLAIVKHIVTSPAATSKRVRASPASGPRDPRSLPARASRSDR